MILGLDTSSALTSIAVVDGTRVVVERRHLDARRHAEVLAPMLAEVCEAVDPSAITAIACGVGPGPYTGLRVGIATALAVGMAWKIPVHGICSLDAIAAAAYASEDSALDDDVFVAVDARRSEVYWAHFITGCTRVDGPLVSKPGDIDASLRAGVWVGHGAAMHADSFSLVLAGDDAEDALGYPQASWVAMRAGVLLASGAEVEHHDQMPLDSHGDDTGATARALRGAALLPARPLYLRRPDAVAAGIAS
ncbi:MAG: tRNA (adenosine(37)-N6)-threonylcarbamoyltransferase complex dimerization subunit type 1 TsaB [Actinobacteria bacterium]|nr:tRNA (adenosine(37)-N6)-threonylcarbamoyltransferase complex dimerization subunit type 1 TsaB [Actinomycetota bacterium]